MVILMLLGENYNSLKWILGQSLSPPPGQLPPPPLPDNCLLRTTAPEQLPPGQLPA